MYIVRCSFCSLTNVDHVCSSKYSVPRFYGGGSPLLVEDEAQAMRFQRIEQAGHVAASLLSLRTVFDPFVVEVAS